MGIVCFNAPMELHGSDLLRHVSRSFFLTLRVLPGAIRPQISVAYLLARATDTIADTRLISLELRRQALREMRRAICDTAETGRAEPPDFGELAAAQESTPGRGSPAERTLLKHIAVLFEQLGALGPADRQRIRDLLETITRGQETDLDRFGSACAEGIAALDADHELEEYTYCVAGCVGEFWTRMCRAHLFPKVELDDMPLLADGIRFGKGLQLVNILRDLPGDLRQGRCYLPRTRLLEIGLEPPELLSASTMGRFRPLYSSYLKQAEDLLGAGWAYTNALPHNEMRVRLACAWPILIGMRTLARLRAGNVLDERHRIKISRGEVRALVLRSVLCYPNARAWNRLPSQAAESPRSWPL